MSELAVIEGHEIDIPSHGPGRALGQRRKPQLRLGMGYVDEKTRAIVKTEFFIPRGDDRAVAKFVARYGDKPRAVDIRLPGSLGGFLDIRHVAFVGGNKGGDGGVLKAIGQVNFATEGVLGGPDKLTVFNIVGQGKSKKLEVDEVYIESVDDPAAKKLGVYLKMSVTFGIPDVLGLGGICEISSKGKESIDTLWLNAVDLYGMLGPAASIALRPKLVLKKSKMLTPGGQYVGVYVLDLYLPQSMDEVNAALREHRELVPVRGATAMALMYGNAPQDRPALAAAPDEHDPDAPLSPTSAGDGGGSGFPASEPEPVTTRTTFPIPESVPKPDPEAAGKVTFPEDLPEPEWAGAPIFMVGKSDKGQQYLLACLAKLPVDNEHRAAIATYVSAELPLLWQRYVDAEAAA